MGTGVKADAAIGSDVVVELPLGDAAANFNLEKAVCSHGLFMMSPNAWDPLSKTLRRPLRLNLDDEGDSLMIQISHPHHSAHSLHIRVLGTRALSSQQQQSLLNQVRKMLRLSEEQNRRLNEFQNLHEEAKERGFGRVFRSPTLFEDMIKCILLCNCQWSRTLSMVQALCELQFELQHPLFSKSNALMENGTVLSDQNAEGTNLAPRTPAGKESTRRSPASPTRHSTELDNNFSEILVQENAKMQSSIFPSPEEKDSLQKDNSGHSSTNDLQPLECTEEYADTMIRNFPSAKELASLDEKFLKKRCNLGYRASRVINLARKVNDGSIDLQELENACGSLSSSDYDKLTEKLKAINGFGPFTSANVLMCMGFYHVIPADSETIRHLKKVHLKCSTIRTVQKDVENIYGKFAPYQFLAYWSEVWHFYEEWFGNLAEMPSSSYKLLTAANMRPRTERGSKRKIHIHERCE